MGQLGQLDRRASHALPLPQQGRAPDLWAQLPPLPALGPQGEGQQVAQAVLPRPHPLAPLRLLLLLLLVAAAAAVVEQLLQVPPLVGGCPMAAPAELLRMRGSSMVAAAGMRAAPPGLQLQWTEPAAPPRGVAPRPAVLAGTPLPLPPPLPLALAAGEATAGVAAVALLASAPLLPRLPLVPLARLRPAALRLRLQLRAPRRRQHRSTGCC